MPLTIPGPSNNHHTNGNGFTPVSVASTNGATTNGNGSTVAFAGATNGNGVQKHVAKSIARVNLPGTTLYEDSPVNREEFVRLAIQSLRDVGYIESAATLEAESGYSMEAEEVSDFRQYVLDGLWSKAEAVLMRLGVRDDDDLWHARLLISQQKYLELLEAKRVTAALHVLRNELAPLNIEADHLHTLSSYIMHSDPAELRQQSGWDGASGNSRQVLLANLQQFISSSVMIPQRRFATLLQQARLYQRHQCLYHNAPLNSTSFSLYADHQCSKSAFPAITTNILKVHTDEVWNISWSHDGRSLASASKDKTAIIWRVEFDPVSNSYQWSQHLVLSQHTDSVSCLAWSLDDRILLTSAENEIRIWNAETGVCLKTVKQHGEPVSTLIWLPDDSGFLSGGLDRLIIHWDTEGKVLATWSTALRVYDMAVTAGLTRLITLGIQPVTTGGIDPNSEVALRSGLLGEPSVGANNMSIPTHGARTGDVRMIVYNLATKEPESFTRLEGEVTSLKVSEDSRYALINHAPNEVFLWDLHTGRLSRKFTGQLQNQHIIRSCFGGVDNNFVVSGSEDSNVYIWHRDTGQLVEILSGHGKGSVNSVAWNPKYERMFASCSDDSTIRIWEAPPPPPPSPKPTGLSARGLSPPSSSQHQKYRRQQGGGDRSPTGTLESDADDNEEEGELEDAERAGGSVFSARGRKNGNGSRYKSRNEGKGKGKTGQNWEGTGGDNAGESSGWA